MNTVCRSCRKLLITALSFICLLSTEFDEKIPCWGEILFFVRKMRRVEVVLSVIEWKGLVYYLI